MKKILILFLIFFIAISDYLTAADELQKSDKLFKFEIINELAIYPDKVISENLLNIPEIALVLQLFKNNFDNEKNTGYFGVNFQEPLILCSFMTNLDLAPYFAVKFKIDNFQKFNETIQYFSQYKYEIKEVSQESEFYKISKSEEEDTAGYVFYLLKKNEYCYILIEFADIAPAVLRKIISKTDDSAANYKILKTVRILKELSEQRYSEFLDDVNKFEIARDKFKIAFFYNKSILLFLNKFANEKIVEFTEELIPAELKNDNCILIFGDTDELSIANFLMTDIKQQQTKRLTPNTEILKLLTNIQTLSALIKLTPNDYYLDKIRNMNITTPGLKYFAVNIADLLNGEIYAFIDIDAAEIKQDTVIFDAALNIENIIFMLLDKIKPQIILGINNKERLLQLLKLSSEIFPNVIEYSNENNVKIILNNQSKTNVYYDFFDNEKYLILSFDIEKLQKIQKISKEKKVEYFEKAFTKNLKYIAQKSGIPEFYFFMDFKKTYKYLWDNGLLNELQKAVFGYLAETLETIYYYDINSNEYLSKIFTIKYFENFRMDELYNIIKSSLLEK
ncbi:MAG TPA: hypothetical protein PLM75_01590 [bacterium]|nr:hypothetical protein [bacterium]HPP86538.1 hypothetical protein [bacterium]